MVFFDLFISAPDHKLLIDKVKNVLPWYLHKGLRWLVNTKLLYVIYYTWYYFIDRIVPIWMSQSYLSRNRQDINLLIISNQIQN